jgi:3-isopropylmalate dehydrogenase
MKNDPYRIAVMPGDGIGHEVMDACLPVLQAAVAKVSGRPLQFDTHHVGADVYQQTGRDIPASAWAAAETADAMLFGAAGDPQVRYPDGREIAPQLDLRERFQLFAGVRPLRLLPGARSPLSDPRAASIDLVLIREQTEGLFSARSIDDSDAHQATDVMTITRAGAERLFDFGFHLARRRKAAGKAGRLTCVDKANVLASMAYFRAIFDERAVQNSDISADHIYVDAAALNLVRAPWDYDVMVTENIFGDILSDLGAGLVGGMGMAPSADIGPEHGLFQPAHGTAPDIVGQDKANPTAMFLSAALMLDWLAERHDDAAARQAASLINSAVDNAYATAGLVPHEHGGPHGTAEIRDQVLRQIDNIALP